MISGDQEREKRKKKSLSDTCKKIKANEQTATSGADYNEDNDSRNHNK